MTPLVSILIPCFNSERWIGQAIESALAQTWEPKEVIVVDDGSTDASLEVIRRFDGRVRWETGPNRGGNAARNRLLELSSGEWLQYLDSDDHIGADKVEKQMKFMTGHPPADVVFSPVIVENWTPDEVTTEVLPIPEPHDLWILLARWYLPQTGGCLWRRSALVEVSGWKVGQPCCQEHELYLRLLKSGKRFLYCPEAGAYYRQWGEHTVCKKDKPETRRRRMEIEKSAEDHLRASGELRPERKWAINQARFETARIAWQHDHREAIGIVEALRESDPSFDPGGVAAPGTYRLLWRLLGFRSAERIADLRRKIAS